MSLQQTALHKALQILDAIKVQYAVLHEGSKYGALDVVPPKPERTGKRARPAFDNIKKFDYENKLIAANPGDILTFEADNYEENCSLRGSIGSFCVRTWGTGAVMTEKVGNTLQVMLIHK
jgi:hypothetical protein